MKAVVLVGGEGTRLRPLTETVPKPLLPVANRSFLHRVLDHLNDHGVHEVVLSSPYLEETFAQFVDERHGDPKITWITEPYPLGTGGAIVNALPHLGAEPFFVLNGDILTDLDLTALLAFHQANAAAATITLSHVEDARPYGLVATGPNGRVLEFREKPADPIPGNVNAGTYVLDPSALEGWPRGDKISIEREIYPMLIESGRPVFGFVTDAYWMDLGTPEKYLRAHVDVLQGRIQGIDVPAPCVAAGAVVDAGAALGRMVVVGDAATVARGARIDESVLHPGCSVGEGAALEGSILGPGSVVGAGAELHGCVLGQDARVPDGMRLDGARVDAGATATA
ncbi:MAG TPA: NDP-sugar synthase [Actinomycetota bacterium]|nr:NDP-sugar synthase [Actinomycetota bacterium]